MNQKKLVEILGVAVLILLGTIIYFATISNVSQPEPVVKQPATPAPAAQAPTQPVATQPAPVANANWKTYTNKEYGFEFKYPENLSIKNNANIGDDKQEFRDLENDCLTNIEFCANPTPLFSVSYGNSSDELSGEKIIISNTTFFKTTIAEMYTSNSYKTKNDKNIVSFTFWVKEDGLTEKQAEKILSTFKFLE